MVHCAHPSAFLAPGPQHGLTGANTVSVKALLMGAKTVNDSCVLLRVPSTPWACSQHACCLCLVKSLCCTCCCLGCSPRTHTACAAFDKLQVSIHLGGCTLAAVASGQQLPFCSYGFQRSGFQHHCTQESIQCFTFSRALPPAFVFQPSGLPAAVPAVALIAQAMPHHFSEHFAD